MCRPDEWAWYQSVPVAIAVHSLTYCAPGSMWGSVMPPTPSWSFGRIIPCRCVEVGNGRRFSTMMRTRSLSPTRITGPGTTPLNA